MYKRRKDYIKNFKFLIKKSNNIVKDSNSIERTHANKIKDILLIFLHIRSKLIMAFIIPVAFIIILGILSYSKASEGLSESYETSTLSNMSNMAKYLDFGFDAVSSKASLLNSNNSLQNYYSGAYNSDKAEENSRYREIQNLVSSNILSEKYISNIYLLSEYGTGISGNGSISSTQEYNNFMQEGEGAYLAEHNLNDAWIGYHPYLDIQSNSSENNYSISYLRYLFSPSNDPIGCIVLDVTYDYVYKVLEGSGLPVESKIAFITNDGREIVKGDIPEDFRFTEQKYYNKAIGDDNDFGKEYIKLNKIDYLFVYSKIETSGSLLCALIPKSVITKQADEVKKITFIVVIAASLIAILVGTFMASGFSNAIYKMIRVLQKIATGDLTNRISEKRKDEFNTLGSSINNMVVSMLGLVGKMSEVSNTITESASVISVSSNSLVYGMKNISTAISDIEQGVAQQAADSESCLHQMSDLAKKINSIYESTHNIEQIADNTKQIIGKGITIVDNLNSKAKDTTAITRDIITDIENLEKESSSIIGIINTINNITAQTNLLSLNATIEAARAGEAGRGFAVVAEEIRKLADQSLKASNEISKIIQRIENQTEKTVNTARSAEIIVISQGDALSSTIESFMDINKHVESLVYNLNQIVGGMEGIEHAKEDTLNAIESISAASEETSAAVCELGTSAENQMEDVNRLNNVVQLLGSDADNLKETVSIFKVK